MMHIFHALLTFLSLLFQTTLAPRLTLWGGRVDFLVAPLCAVCCLAGYGAEREDSLLDVGWISALVMGSVAGFMLDLLYSGEGMYMLQYSMPAILFFVFSLWKKPKGLWRCALFCLIVGVLKELPPFVSLYFQRVEMASGAMLVQAMLGSVMTSLWFVGLYFSMRWLYGSGLFWLEQGESARLMAADKEAARALRGEIRRHRRL